MSEAALKRKVTTDVLNSAVIRRQQTTQDAPNLNNNPVARIMLAEDTTPEEKKHAVAQFLTFPGTKEETRARIKAYREFEDSAQAVREQMAVEIIKLTDTETFSELRSIYDDLNTALLEFDEQMKPLTDIVDAVYVLRTNDKTLDAFREIQSDKKLEEQRERSRKEIESEVDNIERGINQLNDEITSLSGQKSFFGFGGVKESAQQQIAEKEKALELNRQQLARRSQELTDLESDKQQTFLGEFSAEKAKLRELLDISSDQHKERQKAPVDAALRYVSLAKQRIGSGIDHLGKMTEQIDHLYDAGSKMSGVFAILTEGIKEASASNHEIRKTLETKDTDNLITKMTNDEKRAILDDYLSTLGTNEAKTTESYADLTSEIIRIKAMRDANQNQMDTARTLHTQGVAGVASRLSVILQAVSSAALGEASAMAKDNLQAMIRNTDIIGQKEVIKNALGASEMNQDVVKAIEDLSKWGEVVRTSTNIAYEGLSDLRSNLTKIKELAKGVQEDISDSISVNARVATENKPAQKDESQTFFKIDR